MDDEYPAGPDGIDLIDTYIKGWMSKFQTNTTDHENPFKEITFYLDIFALSLSLVIISVYYNDIYISSIATLILILLIILSYLIGVLLKFSQKSISHMIYLVFFAFNIVFFLVDMYNLYHTNKFNKGLPIEAIELSFGFAVLMVFACLLALNPIYRCVESIRNQRKPN